jgi:hypothetical protein
VPWQDGPRSEIWVLVNMLLYFGNTVFNLRDNVRGDLGWEPSLRNRRVIGEQARVVFHQRQTLVVHVAKGMRNDDLDGAEG